MASCSECAFRLGRGPISCETCYRNADAVEQLRRDEMRRQEAAKHPLESIKLKPRTTVKQFAADLKERIERAAVAFDQPGQAERVAGMRYVKGIVDAALSDYDVRDTGDM